MVEKRLHCHRWHQPYHHGSDGYHIFRFSDSLTVQWTTLGFKKTGDKVNLETDILGKYVERMLEKKPTGGLTRETLFENGFF